MNATTTNATHLNASFSILNVGESSVAPSVKGFCESKQEGSITLKVQYEEDLRRLVLPELAREPLIKKVAEVFKINEARVVLKYQDEEGDMVTIGTEEDLLDSHRLSLLRSTVLRLIVSLKKRNGPAASVPRAAAPAALATQPNAVPLQLQDPFADLPSPSAFVINYKVQKKALKEQRKALKEQKKLLKDSNSARSLSPSTPFSPEERKAQKEEKRLLKAAKKDLKKQHKHLKREARRGNKEKDSSSSSDSEGDKDRKKRKDEARAERVARCMAKREARRAAKGAGRSKEIARFVSHVTIPDGTKLSPNQPFTKIWRMRNEGEVEWVNCKLLFVSKRNGDLLGAASEEVPISSPVPAGAEVDVSVNFVAPAQPGRYVGLWRLANPEGRKFGQRVWIKVDVCSDEEKKVGDEIFFNAHREASESNGAPTMADHLRQLRDLGFTDVARNIQLLQKHNGDTSRVIADLIA